MISKGTRPFRGRLLSNSRLVIALFATTALGGTLAYADDDDVFFRPGHLLLSRSVYSANPTLITSGVTQLPPGCVAPNCATANADATYPTVFNNDTVDASFGITARIMLDELRTDGDF